MALIRRTYKKEAFNYILNSLHWVYEDIEKGNEHNYTKDEIARVIESIEKYSTGFYNEDEEKYLSISVPHTDKDIEIISYCITVAEFIYPTPATINYYDTFIEIFAEKYREYKRKRKEKEDLIYSVWEEYKNKNHKPVKKKCYEESGLTISLNEFYEIIRKVEERQN